MTCHNVARQRRLLRHRFRTHCAKPTFRCARNELSAQEARNPRRKRNPPLDWGLVAASQEPSLQPRRAAELLERVEKNIHRVIVGKDRVVRLALAGMVSGGHVLLQDLPGTRSSSSPHRTRLSFTAPIRCPSRSSTASSSRPRWVRPPTPKPSRSSPGANTAIPSPT